MVVITKENTKTRFTRMCIAEAILQMLEDTEYEKLRISSIAERAGVARMTFYKYYNMPSDALEDYMNIIISLYLEKCEKSENGMNFMEYEHILGALLFFDQYADFFLTLAEHGLYGIMIDGVNSFMERHIQTSERLSVYKRYSYAGGLLNTFLQWEKDGKKDSVEGIARMLYEMYHSVSE